MVNLLTNFRQSAAWSLNNLVSGSGGSNSRRNLKPSIHRDIPFVFS